MKGLFKGTDGMILIAFIGLSLYFVITTWMMGQIKKEVKKIKT